jgi:hypothetical protein
MFSINNVLLANVLGEVYRITVMGWTILAQIYKFLISHK